MGKKRKISADAPPEEEVDFLIYEANKNLEKGSYGSAEFKAQEALSVAKSRLGGEHPLVRASPGIPAARLPIPMTRLSSRPVEPAITLRRF